MRRFAKQFSAVQIPVSGIMRIFNSQLSKFNLFSIVNFSHFCYTQSNNCRCWYFNYAIRRI